MRAESNMIKVMVIPMMLITSRRFDLGIMYGIMPTNIIKWDISTNDKQKYFNRSF